MKKIVELTDEEGKEILKFVYPEYGGRDFMGISFEPKYDGEGNQEVTFGFRPIVGIKYHNGQDNCILHFNNSKVVLWLYRNGYDIESLLEINTYFSEMEGDFDHFSFEISRMADGDKYFRDEFKQNWNLDYVKKKCRDLLDKYWLKDYE